MSDSITPRRGRSRERNNNWRGGRTVTEHGYTLVRVGTGHPLADVRGYAYEHRLVASKLMGRWIRPEEQVHHRNGDKADNRPENLEVTAGLAHHRVLHRKKNAGLRLPGEENPAVACACGCNATFPKFDASGRPRRFVSGHNQR